MNKKMLLNKFDQFIKIVKVNHSLCTSDGSGRTEVSCIDYRPCVECVHFNQYWKHYSTAYKCKQECEKYQFDHLEVGEIIVVNLDLTN